MWYRTVLSGWAIISLLICSGCSGKKIYIPPEKESTKEVVIINSIYEPGFYVELDGQEAGFLQERMGIQIAPGKHTLKVFNTETTVDEKPTTVEHKFNLKLDVGKEEVQEINLSWDDPNYSRQTKHETIKLGEKKKEKGKTTERPSITMPGGGM